MPSGPKKRKAAKKKIESLAVSTTTQQGNGGGESETVSPMSPDLGDRCDGKEGGGGGDANGLSGNMEGSQSVGGKAVEDHPTISEKAEEVLQVPLVSESGGAVVPVGIEHVETAKDVVVDISRPEIMVPTKVVAEENLDSSVPCVDVPGATSVHHVPAAVGKELDGRIDDVSVEKVEHSGLVQPPYQEKEKKVEALGSREHPSKEIEQKPEGSCSQESPSDGKDQKKIVILSDHTSTEQSAESRVHRHQKENRGVATEVVFPHQKAQWTSWMSCCGIFDAFTRSNR